MLLLAKTTILGAVMATASVALLATTAPMAHAAASEFDAICVFDRAQCGGKIRLREYTPTTAGAKCEDTGKCEDIPGVSSASKLKTCATDHVKDTAKHLAGLSYVIVDMYGMGKPSNCSMLVNYTAADATTKCNGPVTRAMAVTADDTCYPSSDGKRGYRVKLADDMGVSWSQYADAACTSASPKVLTFKASEVDGTQCVGGSMKILAVKAGAGSVTSDAAAGGGGGATATSPLVPSSSTTSSAPGASTPGASKSSAAPVGATPLGALAMAMGLVAMALAAST